MFWHNVLLVSLLVITSSLAQAQTATGATSPTFKMSGGAALFSNYVRRGLTQTDKDPALQGSFWFNFGPQFRMGLWGSNVRYQGGDEHLNLRTQAEIKVSFSQNTEMLIKYSLENYFSGTRRNGDVVGLHFLVFGYRIGFDSINNWEGTSSRASYFSVGKTFDVFGNWKWANDLGFSMLTNDAYKDYFDIRSMLGYKVGGMLYEVGATMTSQSSQFNNKQGDLFWLLGASTEF